MSSITIHKLLIATKLYQKVKVNVVEGTYSVLTKQPRRLFSQHVS